MLQFNLRQILNNKGIDRHTLFLSKHGLTTYTASRLLNNRITNINLQHIEILCTALNCTIDELFTWRPGKDVDVDKHPLQHLRERSNEFYVGDKLKMLSPKKLEAVKEFVKGLEE